MNVRETSSRSRVGRGEVPASPRSMNPPVSRLGRMTLIFAVLGFAVTHVSWARPPKIAPQSSVSGIPLPAPPIPAVFSSSRSA